MVVHAWTTNRATDVSVPKNGQAGTVKRAQVSVYKAFFTSPFEEMVYKEIYSFDEIEGRKYFCKGNGSRFLECSKNIVSGLFFRVGYSKLLLFIIIIMIIIIILIMIIIMIVLSMMYALEYCTFLRCHCSTSFDQLYLLYRWVYQKSGQT